MKNPFQGTQKCLLMAALLTFCVLDIRATAATPFKARRNLNVEQVLDIALSASDTIAMDGMEVIYALSIDATIQQPRESSFVRVVLEDVEGHNYLVAESDRFRNDTSSVVLTGYCEETTALPGITPLRLKCYLSNASLRITGIQTSDQLPLRTLSAKTLQTTSRQEQVQDIVDRINEYNVRHGKLWQAGVTPHSLLSLEEQGEVVESDAYLANMKYYVDGIYEIGERTVQTLAYNSPYVDSFDWRDRHGKNWITPVKDQGATGYCYAFAVAGMMEAVTNLYFNDTINLDLSEQSVIGYMPPHGVGNVGEELNFIRQYGILDEASVPYTGVIGINSSIRPVGLDSISFEVYCTNGKNAVTSDASGDVIKECLIKYGPGVWGYQYPVGEKLHGVNFLRHTMTIVGYGTISMADIQNYLQVTSVGGSSMSTNPAVTNLLGRTYWIMKDSYGTTTDSIYKHNGYRYIVFNDYSKVQESYFIVPPIYRKGYSDSDIICEDHDGDGFFYWGQSENPPMSLPAWAEQVKDGDDSNPQIGMMNAYGYLTDISDLYSSDQLSGTVDDDVFLSEHGGRFLRGNRTLNAGATLTITHEVACYIPTTITLQSGSTLRINGGTLYNPTIVAQSGCSIIIENGGRIVYDKKDPDFNLPIGVTLEITEGGVIF